MISKLNEQALLKTDNTAFRTALLRKVNQLVDAVNVGVVHDNKVEADRKLEGAVNEIYDSLPISVIAEMIEEEFQDSLGELELEE